MKNVSKPEDTEILSNREIKYNDKSVSTTAAIAGVYINSKYYVIDFGNCTLYTIDSTLQVTNKCNLKKANNFQQMDIIDVGVSKNKMIIQIYGSQNTDGSNYVLLFDTESNTTEVIDFQRFTGKHDGLVMFYPFADKYLLSRLNLQKSPSESSLFDLYDNEKKYLKSFGTPDSNFFVYKNLENFYREFVILYDNEIYTLHNCSDKIHKYDKNLKQTEVIKLRVPNMDRALAADAPKSGRTGWTEFMNTTTGYMAFLRDEVSGNFCVQYRNFTFPAGVDDFFSPDQKIENVVRVFSKNGEMLFERKNNYKKFSVVDISGDVVRFIHTTGEKIQIGEIDYAE